MIQGMGKQDIIFRSDCTDLNKEDQQVIDQALDHLINKLKRKTSDNAQGSERSKKNTIFN